MRPRKLAFVAVVGCVTLHCGGPGSSGGAGAPNSDAGADSGESSGGSGGSGSSSGSGAGSSSGSSGGSSGGSDSGTSSGSGGGSGSSSGGGVDGGGLVLSIDLGKGPMRQFQPPAKPVTVSPYVYGINAFAIWQQTTKWGLARQGGNAFTAWNWTNNYSNSGADYCYWQGQDSGGNALAGTIAATGSGFPITTAQSLGVAYLATAPIVDHVSAAFSNNTGINGLCPGAPTCSTGTANGFAANSGNLSFASTNGTSAAFVANAATKPGGNFCTCQPGGSCASGCTVDASGPVYQDEFANFLKVRFGSGGAPVFMMLDNEPNYWPGTHPEIWPYAGTPGCGTSGTVTFDDVVNRNVTYATAIRNAWPATKIFGPVVAQDGIVYAGNYNDPHLPTMFADYYLSKMAAASSSAGKSLIDAFDVHYYTSRGTASQCLQAPRMFWDPNFTDFSASVTDGIDFGWSGPNNEFDTALYPRQMIPRLLGKIATAYAGQSAAPGLSFSEYNAGCEQQIEGGVAQADLLGIFGREGVFAAMAWPLKAVTDSNQKLTNYLVAAYDLYRNYDGSGSVVGDTAVRATTPDVEDTSVYAFSHSTDATKVDVVVLNKTNATLPVILRIQAAPALSTASLYQLVGTKAAVAAVTAGAPPVSCSGGTCELSYSLPPTSATTFVLR